jgi:hypothetical protein
MNHLSHIIRDTHGMDITQLKKYYKDEYECSIIFNEELGLFCPKYHLFKTKFSKVGALATRGTVFGLEYDGTFGGHIACLPFFKFFNKGERHAYDGQEDDIISIQRKADGSLIKLFNHRGEWVVATNGTVVCHDNFRYLFEHAINLSIDNFDHVFSRHKTYLFELCSPENKIVVEYQEPHAKLLLTRCKYTLIELPSEPFFGHFDVIENVNTFDPNEIGEEGVVMVYKGGHRVKCKTNWYCSLHKVMGKKFNGHHWDSVVSAIHGGFYDDVMVMVPPHHRERATHYMICLRDFDAHVETMISPYKLEKQIDKEKLIDDLKNGFFEKAIEKVWLRKLVMDVLFGKHPDLYVHATKPGKSAPLRKYIEIYKLNV